MVSEDHKDMAETMVCIAENSDCEEMAIISINYSPYLIKHVPREFITKVVIDEFLKLMDGVVCESVLEHVPTELITRDFIDSIYNLQTLKFVPSRLVTLEMVENVLKREVVGDEIKYIPTAFIYGLFTDEIIIKVVKENTENVKFVPDELLTTGVIETLLDLETNDNIIENLSKKVINELFTIDMIEKALDHDVDNIRFVPKEMITMEMMMRKFTMA